MIKKREVFGLTDSEKHIWEAAYGAAFVRGVLDEVELRKTMRQETLEALEKALNCGQAELAEYIADKAVLLLRKWRDENVPERENVGGAPSIIIVEE